MNTGQLEMNTAQYNKVLKNIYLFKLVIVIVIAIAAHTEVKTSI